MEFELLGPAAVDPKKPMPFLVSVSGRDQFHVNGFSQRLLSENWVLAMALRPKGAPLLFLGNGTQGDGVWHLRELCGHLLKEYSVSGKRFLLVGVSNGGNSVLRFASLWPELCCGVAVATGSLKGLVDLPAGCRKLQGLPVDMYVGTKDECGFYEPMVALRDHFKEVGHRPVASLTIFQDVGHICSPMIDDFLIHGKIGMMFLHAGVMGTGLPLAVPKSASRPSEKILASLIAFARDLGLDCGRESDGGLQVNAAGGPLMTMRLPALKKGVAATASPPPVAHFKAEERVEVWSNSKQRWEEASVKRTSEGEEGGVQVLFEDERGKLTKMIPWACVSKYLRLPQRGGAEAGSLPCLEGYHVGDLVAIWSASNKKWIQDGRISLLSREQGLTVEYCEGSLSKLVPLESAANFLRRPGAVEEDTSPQPSQLPTGPSRLLVPASGAELGGHIGPSRPSSASRSPISSPMPISREVLYQVPSQDASRQPSKPVTGPSSRYLLQASGGEAAAAAVPRGSTSSPRAPAVASPKPASGEVSSPMPLLRELSKPIGGSTQLPLVREISKPTGGQAGAQFPAKCPVSIWSASSQKWFDDGTVDKVVEEGLIVVYSAGSMQKLVPLECAPEVLRHRLQ